MTFAQRTTGLVAAGAAALSLLAGCGDDSAGPDEAVTVEDVVEDDPATDAEQNVFLVDALRPNADQYVGEVVTVSGEVTAQINDTIFHIASDPGGDGLLILSDTPIVDQLDSDDVVRVTGTVIEVTQDTFEDAGGVRTDAEFDIVKERHAIEATDIEVIGQVEDEIDEEER